MLFTPELEECIDFAKAAGAKSIHSIPVKPKEDSVQFCCHRNCENYESVLGYTIAKDSHGIFHGFLHSVIKENGKLIDITPTPDNRNLTIFMHGTNFSTEHISYAQTSVYINKTDKEETEMLYYVYALIDPRTNLPFYIGKGKDDRALSHFSEKSLEKENNTKKTAKIKKLKSLGYSPVIEFYAQNIQDEQLAYDIEKSLILKYGRIGYEQHGILTNICISNNPPNHCGKTYQEIYGKKADEQLIKRALLQKEAGGWFKGHTHKNSSKSKISAKTSGLKNPKSSGLTESDLIEIGKQFCNTFNLKISLGKWNWWAGQNNIPKNILKTFRFNGISLFDVWSKEFGAEVIFEPTAWYYNTKTMKTKNVQTWRLLYGETVLDEEWVPGRPRSKKQKSSHIV